MSSKTRNILRQKSDAGAWNVRIPATACLAGKRLLRQCACFSFAVETMPSAEEDQIWLSLAIPQPFRGGPCFTEMNGATMDSRRLVITIAITLLST